MLEVIVGKSLRKCLRQTRDQLHQLRKKVASEGHLEAMTAIDSLIFVAEEEAKRSLVKEEGRKLHNDRS